MRLTYIILTLCARGALKREAQAAPPSASGSSSKTTTTSPRTSVKATFHGPAKPGSRQEPPLGGCDVNDVSGTLTSYYTDGALATLEASWTAKVLCTTTASGQSLANISISTSLWHNGSPVASGTTFTCSNCNLGNGIGSWECVDPTCAGSYWVGAIDRLTLPAGWQWTSAGEGCTIPSATVLQCAVTTDPVTISASD